MAEIDGGRLFAKARQPVRRDLLAALGVAHLDLKVGAVCVYHTMIETAVDEKILKPVAKRKIIHEYGEPLDAEVQVYALEEIMAEKLRAILQHAEQLKERGWSRSRARDYYDLWRIMGAYKDRLDLSGFSSFLQEKCAVRKVAFADPEDFFQETMLAYIKKTWVQWLGPLVPGLPPFETVIGELRPQIASLVLATGGGPSL